MVRKGWVVLAVFVLAMTACSQFAMAENADKKAARLYDRAIECEKNNQYYDAQECFSNITKIDANYKDAAARLSYYGPLKLANYAAIHETLAGAQKADCPRLIAAAQAFLARGWFTKAEVLYAKVLELDNAGMTGITVYHDLGILNFARGDIDKARKYFENAMKISEEINNANAIYVLNLYLGTIGFIEGKKDRMDKYFAPLREKNIFDLKTAFVAYVLEKQAGGDTKKILDAVKPTRADNRGMLMLLDVFKDPAKLDAFLGELAKQVPAPAKGFEKNVWPSELYCYTGYYFLANGDKAKAKEYFSKGISYVQKINILWPMLVAGLKECKGFKPEMLGADTLCDYPKAGYKPVAVVADAEKFDLGKDIDAPYAKMKDGDWVIYGFGNLFEAVQFTGAKGKAAGAKVTIRKDSIDNAPLAAFDKTASVKMKAKGIPEPLFWMNKSISNMIISPKAPNVEETGKETITVGDKKIECRVYVREDANGTSVKNWYSDEVPFGGLVKVSFKDNTIMQLVKFGAKGDEIPGGNNPIRTAFYSADGTPVVFDEKQLDNFIQTYNELAAAGPGIANTIIDTQTITPITFDKMMDECSKVRVVFVGERHDAVPCHQMQLDVVKAMYKKNKELAIGFEMFYRTEEIQKGLDDFISGKIDEKEFREKYYDACWSKDWYEFYRDVFMFAKENKIKLVGLNCPKPLMKQFKADPTKLTPEERKGFAKDIDFKDEQHKKITMWNFRPMASKGMEVESLYPGQCLWDDTMGESVVNYLADKPKAQMVVLVGCLHVAYRITMPGRAQKKAKAAGFDLTYKVLFPHEARNIRNSAFEELTRLDITDYLYYIPEVERKAEQPKPGEVPADNWVKAYYKLINEGDLEGAEAMLKNDPHSMAAKIMDRIKEFRQVEKLAKEGKYQEARDLMKTMSGKYSKLIKVYNDKIDQTEKTGKWPEK